MNERIIHIDRIGEQTRVAVVEDGQLVEVAYETLTHRSLIGNIYKARVQNVLRGMSSAFVDLGTGKNGFISLDDLPPIARAMDAPKPSETRQLRVGETLIVQVIKEPGGDKGPRVTCSVTLAGRLVVLLPTLATVGVSHHIQDEATRERLLAQAKAACPEGMGLIVRTAAENAPEEAFAAEAKELCEIWQAIHADAEAQNAPALLCEEGDLAAKSVQDLYVEGKTSILEGAPDFDLQPKIDRAVERRVWLPSGGYLVFDVCEAMTVIDVNTGKYTGKRNLAETVLRLNTEAAREAGRQIRLRDLGGIILIDFVDMETDEAREAVLETMREALQNDRAKSRLYGFTQTGLLEMTRRPVVSPLHKSIRKPCPTCKSEGFVPTESALIHDALRVIRRMRDAGDESELTLRAHPAVVEELERIGAPEDLRVVADRSVLCEVRHMPGGGA